MRTRLLITLLFAAATVSAKPLAIHARRMLDVRSGAYMERYIVIEGERITHVVVDAPPDADILDLGNLAVMPGLIDCHVHLLTDYSDYSATQALRMSGGMKVLFGLKNAQDYLDRGFTSVRDAGEADTAYGHVALRDAIKRGMFRGPRMVVSGIPISSTGGHADLNVLAPDVPMTQLSNIADSVDAARAAVRHDIKFGVDWIKVMATGGVMDPISDFNSQELSDEQLAAIVEVAHRAHRKVMAHAEGTAGIKAAVRAGVDSIEHGTILDEEAATLMASKGTWLVPTLETFERGVQPSATPGADPVMLEKGKAILSHLMPSFALANKHHIRIAFGSDDEPRFAVNEFDSMVRGGLSPIDALRTATSSAAELLSIDAGVLEAGRYADIIAVDGDPLHDVKSMAKVVFVMKGGEVIKSLAK
jgi:imidazolonepropionase-like amidohydrolase